MKKQHISNKDKDGIEPQRNCNGQRIILPYAKPLPCTSLFIIMYNTYIHFFIISYITALKLEIGPTTFPSIKPLVAPRPMILMSSFSSALYVPPSSFFKLHPTHVVSALGSDECVPSTLPPTSGKLSCPGSGPTLPSCSTLTGYFMRWPFISTICGET